MIVTLYLIMIKLCEINILFSIILMQYFVNVTQHSNNNQLFENNWKSEIIFRKVKYLVSFVISTERIFN